LLLTPIAVDGYPDAIVESPAASEASPEAIVKLPKAVEVLPDAVELLPMAKEATPFAITFAPAAKDKLPMLSLFQCAPSTLPALNAAFCGYHIIREPGPCTGGLKLVVGDTVTGPVNTTLLSATCRRATGDVVPMPTFCEKQLNAAIKAINDNNNLFIKNK
jgi:hypothetical protein